MGIGSAWVFNCPDVLGKCLVCPALIGGRQKNEAPEWLIRQYQQAG